MNAFEIYQQVPSHSRFSRLDEIGKILSQVELERFDQEWSGFLHEVGRELQGPLGTLGISLQLMQEILHSKYNGGPSPESLRSLSRICGRNFNRLEKVIHSFLPN
jgi:hypothetical protein